MDNCNLSPVRGQLLVGDVLVYRYIVHWGGEVAQGRRYFFPRRFLTDE